LLGDKRKPYECRKRLGQEAGKRAGRQATRCPGVVRWGVAEPGAGVNQPREKRVEKEPRTYNPAEAGV